MELIEQYLRNAIRQSELYEGLRELWGKEVFEDTRHCFENMKQRARKDYAPLDPRFENFGEFLSHMGPRPRPTDSIHRIDNEKGYSPENCAWADKKTQSRERSNTIYLTCDGETLPLTVWAERLAVPPRILRGRKAKGWTDREVIHGPQERQKRAFPFPEGVSSDNGKRLQSLFRQAGGRTAEQWFTFLVNASRKRLDELNRQYVFPPGFRPPTTPEAIESLRQWRASHAKWTAILTFAEPELNRVREQKRELAYVRSCFATTYQKVNEVAEDDTSDQDDDYDEAEG